MRLESREKKVLGIGGGVAALILLYLFVIEPLSIDLARKRDAIPQKEKQLAEMKVLQKEYQAMRSRLEEAQAAAARRGPLLTEIENITKRSNLGGKIVSLKPQAGTEAAGFKESIVEIRLDSITLYDVVNYIYRLESASLRIKRLIFKPRFDDPKLLNATVLVASAE